MMPTKCAPGVSVLGAVSPEQQEILSVRAQVFLATLQRCFNGRRRELLAARVARQKELDAGVLPSFLAHTRAIREDGSWRCAPPAPGLVDR
jgi:malate synthase